MKDDADEISVAVPTKKKHHHHVIQKVSAVSEDEDDDESVTSDQSEDSISTKSSHVMSRKRSNSRNRGGRESTRTARSRSVRNDNCGKWGLLINLDNCCLHTCLCTRIRYTFIKYRP